MPEKYKYANDVPDGERIVIAGISGAFPQSRNMYELRDNLYNKIDMITPILEDVHPEVPKRLGIMKDLEKFDAEFFSISSNEANAMDPCTRQVMEKTFETILDAGMHPMDLSGTSTCVYVGAAFSETERSWFRFEQAEKGYNLIGCSRAIMGNRINYWFNLHGASFNVDTACSSAMYAIDLAYNDMRRGRCDSAIVVGENLCLSDAFTLQFQRLGVLSPDGRCKTFDNAGDGYVRSEAVGAILLLRAKNAKRIYAELVHTKTNCDGYKSQGITYPSGPRQMELISDFYNEISVDPNDVSYIECHGTGTKVGDLEEGSTIVNIFCTKRTKPLPVGSVKSNLGHSEAASGMGSISKIVLTFETDMIPPNLHFQTPRTDIPGLMNGQFYVVTECTKFDSDYIATSGFGFGGANCHILLKRNIKTKLNNGQPDDDIPRIVCFSGRTTAAIETIINDLKSRPLDAEYIRLYHEIFRKDITKHLYRAYIILQKNQPCLIDSDTMYYQTQQNNPVWFLIGGYNSKQNILSIIRAFIKFPIFAKTIKTLYKALEPYNINLFHIINGHKIKLLSTGACNILALTVLQIGIVDILNALNFKYDHLVGFNSGQIVCAYADNFLTAQEAILTVYRSINSCKQILSDDDIDNQNWLTEDRLEYFQSQHFYSTKLTNIESNAIIVQLTQFDIFNSEYNLTNSICLTNSDTDCMNWFLKQLGLLYLKGLNPHLACLYPEIIFPVARSTPMISPLIKWDHGRDYYVERDTFFKHDTSGERSLLVTLKDPKYESMAGHIIDGRNLFPATGYLMLVWETFAIMIGELVEKVAIQFENVKFLRATTLTSDIQLQMSIMISKGTGYFELLEGGSIVVSGFVKQMNTDRCELLNLQSVEPTPTHQDILSLTSKDVYKELRLRGYNYQGLFKGILSVDNNMNIAEIHWNNDWIAFLDNLLQLEILHENSRFLYVPISLKRLTIYPHKHKQHIHAYTDDKLSVTAYKYSNLHLIQAGGVEVFGLHATSINRRKTLGEPILERQLFIPYRSQEIYTQDDALRIIVQLILENNPCVKVKVIEIDNYKDDILAPSIFSNLNDLPLIQSEIIVLTKNELKNMPKNITNIDQSIERESNALFIIGTNLLNEQNNLINVSCALKNDDCFIISREKYSKIIIPPAEYDLIAEFNTNSEKLVVLRKQKIQDYIQPVSINITYDNDFKWLKPVQDALESNQNLIIYTQNESINGLIGFVNCLNREFPSENIQCVLIDDKTAPDFNPSHEFYTEQLIKGLKINIYKNGQWGCVRHLRIDNITIETETAYSNVTTRGDLSSFQWIELPTIKQSNDKMLIDVYYSAMNFRDVMTASGKLSIDFIVKNSSVGGDSCLPIDVVQGLEFSGRSSDGKRYMGIVARGALANRVEADRNFMWMVPDDWTLEDAATVPVVYSTVYYALLVNGLKANQSILIHAGSGGIGIAAINVALYYQCNIFTTVGTPEKRDFIKQYFPQLKDSHIGNSRDTSFEQMILQETNGCGVDFVLNSLADDKLLASVRCLAENGKFLEIGKFDLANDNKLGMEIFLRGASFHGVMLDNAMYGTKELKQSIYEMVANGIQAGAVKPIPRTVFDFIDPEKPYRFMASGKHIGKVLLQFREEEKETVVAPSQLLITSNPRLYCDQTKSVVILGGLGGFGLELTNWLIERGCRNIVLSSRFGITKGYQSVRVRKWRSYGINIVISTSDISTENGCLELLKTSQQLGPIEAIFNLAALLRDGLIENQTVDMFRDSFKGKALATFNLDKLTRIHCTELKYFVVFSSVSSGRGNAGQTNYGMANSVMECICEQRIRDGYPALAIQWGAIGEVGLVADMQDDDKQLEIGGTLQQSIHSCLDTIDVLIKQNEPVVASMIVAEKSFGFGAGGNLAETIFHMVGIKDVNTVSHQSTLAELGMDSMMAVEIKQTLEREYELFLTPQDIRSLTFNKLSEIQSNKSEVASPNNTSDKIINETNNLKLLMRTLGDGHSSLTDTIIDMNNVQSKTAIFLFPGIEGQSTVFQTLSNNIKFKTYGLQYDFNQQTDNILHLANQLFVIIKKKLKADDEFYFIAHSFGSILAIKIAKMLELQGYKGRCLLIDGSPFLMQKIVNQTLGLSKHMLINDFEAAVLVQCLSFVVPVKLQSLENELAKLPDWATRVDFVIKNIPPNTNPYSLDYTKSVFNGIAARLKAILYYDEMNSNFKLNTPIALVRCNIQVVKDITDDYDLSKICDKQLESVIILDGDHFSVLENTKLPQIINNFFDL